MTSRPVTGQQLRAVMAQASVTIPELVERLAGLGHEVSESTVKRLRAGSDPDASTLVAIARALGVGLADLLLDPAQPHWPTAWTLSDASAGDTAQVLRLVRLVDNAARRYRDATARRDLAPNTATGERAAADAFEALTDLDALLGEADELWPGSDLAGLVPADVAPAVEDFKDDRGRWFVGDPPDAQGRTSGTLGQGSRSIQWPNATEAQVLHAITEGDDS